MRKFFVLLRVSLRSMLHTLSFGHGKKRAASGIGALLFLGVLALYMSGVYSFLLAESLYSINLLDFLLPMMAMLSCMMALLFSAMGASGVVFGNKDSDLLLSMPVSSFSIMLSKILALYIETLLFCGLWMIPTCLSYYLKAPGDPVGFVLRSIVSIPFLPFLPTLLGVLFGYFIGLFSARAKRKALISNLLYLVMFCLLIVGSMQINKIPALLVTNADSLRRLLNTWLLPFGLLQRGVADGQWLSLLTFCAVCAIPFFVIVYLLSAKYKSILSSLSSHSLRTDFKLSRVQVKGKFASLLRKEVSRYFGTPIYLFNTGFGALMMLGGSIYLCFARETALSFIAMTQMTELVAPFVCIALIFCLGTICPTSACISLEGKTLWVLKEAPVSTKQIFSAKLLLNLIVAWPATVISLILASWVLSIPIMTVVCIFVLCTVFVLHTAQFGLLVNLLLPKMDAASDILVVKQSAASMCGIFGGLLVAGIGVGLYTLGGGFIGFVPFTLIASFVLSIVCILEWRWLMHQGVQRFAAL